MRDSSLGAYSSSMNPRGSGSVSTRSFRSADDPRQLAQVQGAPVAQVAAPRHRRVALQVVAYQQLRMGLEVPRDDARSAEGVEYPETVPAEPPLDLVDRAADLPEQSPLVPDIRDQLAGQVLRVLHR